MWKVYCDDYLLLNTELEDYKIIDPSLTLELNKTGKFTFTIYSNHPNYERLKKMKSIITVYEDNYLYFRGRILNDDIGWHNERKVSCEGELSFLLDSIQRPFEFPENEDDPATPEDYFTFLINRHNEQVDAEHQFVVGTVTVTDPNNYISRSDTEYSTTWDLLNEGLIKSLGGYLWVDNDQNGNRRINYYADFDILSSQSIEFGKNLLSLATERNGEDIATFIVPLGATIESEEETDTDERLTITELPDEETTDICKVGDYVYSKAGVAAYGKIVKVFEWDKVTEASNLLIKAKEQLANSLLETQSITLSAADLHAAGQNFNSFRLGTYIRTKSEPHEDAHALGTTYLVKKLSIKLLKPASNKLTVGATIYTFTEENKRQQEEQLKQIETNVEKSQTKVIRELEHLTDSKIAQSNTEILTSVSDSYYTKDETNTLVSSVETEFRQTADGFEMQFNELSQNIDDVQVGSDAKFEEIRKYIRFEDGNIILGEQDNELTLKIENDIIGFYEGAVQVAYFTNHKLYVTDGEFINTLKLGKFAFIPRANGNLSFKKVVD